MARESKVSDAMKAFDRGEKVAGSRKSEYSCPKGVCNPQGINKSLGNGRAEMMDKGLPLHGK